MVVVGCMRFHGKIHFLINENDICLCVNVCGMWCVCVCVRACLRVRVRVYVCVSILCRETSYKLNTT